MILGTMLLMATLHGYADDVDYSHWMNLLDKEGLCGFAGLSDSKNSEWPRLSFGRGKDLSQKFLERLREYERELQKKPIPIGEVIRTYGRLSKVLRASGGYTNLVLADASGRLLVSRLCNHVVMNPEEAEQDSALLTELDSVKLNVSLLQTCIREEMGHPKRQINKDLVDLADEMSFDDLLTLAGTDYAKMMNRLASKDQPVTTSRLLESKSLSTLIWRSAETDLLATVHLRGMVGFLRKGGKLSDIRLDDITKYKAIMGNDRAKYSFAPLKVKKLWPSHLKTLRDDFAVLKSDSPFFYRIALE